MSSKWDDLSLRAFTGAILALIAASALFAPPPFFPLFVVLLTLAALWEIWRMGRFKMREIGYETGDMTLLLGYASLIFLGVLGLLMAYALYGPLMVLYAVLVVAAADIMGYVGGRLIGGPKFCPRLSPKKTWSGAVSGWIGAAVVGALDAPFVPIEITFWPLVVLSIALSMASQAGDLAESGLKRRMGVKDSSRIIPGHGGVLDRFDGLIFVGIVLLMTPYVFGT